ncbi:MAG: LPS export ABC transporter periplasmic protein LptC [Candidatus Brocadiia bacterium]
MTNPVSTSNSTSTAPLARAALFCIVVGAVVLGLAAWSAAIPRAQTINKAERFEETPVHMVEFRSFSYSDEAKQGGLVYSLKGDSAEFFNSDLRDVRNVVLDYYIDKAGDTSKIQLTGERGEYHRLDSVAELTRRVTITGNAKMPQGSGSWKVNGSALKVNLKTGEFSLSGLFEVQYGSYFLKGSNLSGKLNPATSSLSDFKCEAITESGFRWNK